MVETPYWVLVRTEASVSTVGRVRGSRLLTLVAVKHIC